MSQTRKNKTNQVAGENKSRSIPFILPRYPQEAKKLEEVNAMLERAVLLPHHSRGRIKNSPTEVWQKNTRKETNSGAAPLLLPRNPREAKKLAEINTIIDKMIFLPEETDKSVPKRKR